MKVSASRRKPSSGLISGVGRQYAKACPGLFCSGETGRPLGARVKNIVKKWTASLEYLLEQKRPGLPVSATNLQ